MMMRFRSSADMIMTMMLVLLVAAPMQMAAAFTTFDPTSSLTTTTKQGPTLLYSAMTDEPQPRRQFLSLLSSTVAVATMTPAAAHAKKPPVSQDQAFDALRFELYNTQGSIAQLERAVQNQDYATILGLTKEMDQSLRKQVMGNAKYFINNNAGNSEKAQLLCNSATFDLIGMNKSARPQQENAERAAQYLNELVQDLEQLLAMEPPAAAV